MSDYVYVQVIEGLRAKLTAAEETQAQSDREAAEHANRVIWMGQEIARLEALTKTSSPVPDARALAARWKRRLAAWTPNTESWYELNQCIEDLEALSAPAPVPAPERSGEVKLIANTGTFCCATCGMVNGNEYDHITHRCERKSVTESRGSGPHQPTAAGHALGDGLVPTPHSPFSPYESTAEMRGATPTASEAMNEMWVAADRPCEGGVTLLAEGDVRRWAQAISNHLSIAAATKPTTPARHNPHAPGFKALQNDFRDHAEDRYQDHQAKEAFEYCYEALAEVLTAHPPARSPSPDAVAKVLADMWHVADGRNYGTKDYVSVSREALRRWATELVAAVGAKEGT